MEVKFLSELFEEPETNSYNVVENVSGTFLHVAKADHVWAICGSEVFIIKSRDSKHTPSPFTPRKPDFVFGFYHFPEPHVREIALRKRA